MAIMDFLNVITFGAAALIIVATLWAYIYVRNAVKNSVLVEKRRWIEQLPSVVSTLGVLGTFAGITLGLYNFDTSDLDSSIPLLLSGLKTAFFTSLAGMIGSLILSRYVNNLFDKSDKGVSDVNIAAGIITKAVQDMSDANISMMNSMIEKSDSQLNALLEMQSAIKESSNAQIVEGLKKIYEELLDIESSITQDLKHQTKTLVENIKEGVHETMNHADALSVRNITAFNSVYEKLEAVKVELNTIAQDTSNINSINENVASSLEALGNLDVSEQHVSEEIDKLSLTLSKEVGELNQVVKSQFSEFTIFINKVNTQIASEILNSLNAMDEKMRTVKENIHSMSDDVANIPSINENVASALEALGNLDVSEQHVSEEIEKLGNKMTTDISSIVVKMTETDKLLNIKFDEFTDLMKKNDVEALSVFMKQFASEFQSQMNNLINKLVEDNFKELNKSITTLNVWQQENKSMIEQLIKQYKQMSDDFETTSETLGSVEEKTALLVADDGKLSSIIESLNDLFLHDKSFIKVMEKLKETAELNKKNSETLNTSSRNLKDWIVTQSDFVDGVNSLIDKLDEISRFRDYTKDFWKDTKQKLKEGVDILNQATQQLNSEVVKIDKHFYARLNTTLANLDACIQAMYNDKIKEKK